MEAKLVRRGEGLAIDLPAYDVERFGLREGQTVEVIPKASSSIADPMAGRRIVNGHPNCTLDEMIAEMERLGPDFEPPTVDWGPDVGSEIIDDDDPR